MSLTRWLSERLGLSGSRERASRPASPRKRPTFRPTLEALEHRYLLSTLTVLNTHDSGAGSLRAEIAAAHSNDTIVFAPSLDGQTITLTSGELLIKKNLTIAGPGAGELTVSGNNASRVFEVASKENVTLSGLTISDGAAPGVGQAGEGAGILNHGTLTVSGSTLSGNSAGLGGGILNDGTLTVSNSTLTGNSASYFGGGILNDGTLTVSGSTLSGNSAASAGGGIYNDGTVTVKNSSSITGNTAPVGFGADIYNLGVLYLDSTSIIGILDGIPAT